MQPPLHYFLIITSLLWFLLIIELIRRGRLRAGYSLIWLFSAIVVFLLSVFRGSLRYAADLLQIEYAPAFIFMVGLGLLGIIQLSHSIVVTVLSRQNRDLAQQLAILELQLSQLSTLDTKSMGDDLSKFSIEYLWSLSHELRSHGYLSELIKRTLELARESVGASSGSFFLFDEKGKIIENALTYEGQTVSRDGQELMDIVDKGLAGWVIENRQAVLVRSTFEDVRWFKRPWDKINTQSRSAMSVPLEAGNRVVGVLTLIHTQPNRFSEYNLAFLIALTTNISFTNADILTTIRQEPGEKFADQKEITDVVIDH